MWCWWWWGSGSGRSRSWIAIPSGAKVVDLSADYVLPGLIDCHTHLGARADRYDEIDSFLDTPFDSAIAAW